MPTTPGVVVAGSVAGGTSGVGVGTAGSGVGVNVPSSSGMDEPDMLVGVDDALKSAVDEAAPLSLAESLVIGITAGAGAAGTIRRIGNPTDSKRVFRSQLPMAERVVVS